MPQCDKSAYTDKQKRKAKHIEEGYEERGVEPDEAARRAWATVNATDHGGKKSGSGRGKTPNLAPSRKGGESAALHRPREALKNDLNRPRKRLRRGNEIKRRRSRRSQLELKLDAQEFADKLAQVCGTPKRRHWLCGPHQRSLQSLSVQACLNAMSVFGISVLVRQRSNEMTNARRLIAVSLCSAGLGFASLAVAQENQKNSVEPQQPARQPAVQVGQRAHWKNSDQSLATCVAIANQEEVALAKFAEEKANSREVKDFAKMLVSDHQAFLKKLEKYAPEAARDNYLTEQHQTASNDATKAPGGVQVRVQPAGGANPAATTTNPIQQTAGVEINAGAPGIDFVQLHREIANECIRTSKDELSKKDGKKFDECFIGHQIAKHAEMKTKLTVFERHASGELKDLFASGRETTEKHMQKAESIMKDLDSHKSDSQK